MAGNRGDDIVLAGSGGQRASATLSAIFDQTHRSTALILAIDSLIIVLIAWDFASISQQYFGRAAMLIWAIPLFITTSTWFSYRSRRRLGILASSINHRYCSGHFLPVVL